MLRVGIVGVAHVHAPSFVSCFLNHPGTEVVGVYDYMADRASEFAASRGLQAFSDLYAMLDHCDAVVICSENTLHAGEIEACVSCGKAILCEKPLAVSGPSAAAIEEAVTKAGVIFMTAFPCPFAPAFQELQRRVTAGDLGEILAICATNQGSCPMGWFVEEGLSGGGAMIDHTVHVADLIHRLLGVTASSARASIGHGMYELAVDDTGIVTVEYPGGVFATIDTSWSKKGYKTWGNVCLKVVGSKGIAEIDLFGQGVDVYSGGHSIAGVGANLDGLMVNEFVSAVTEGRAPLTTLHDGLAASRVAIAGYASVKSKGELTAV